MHNKYLQAVLESIVPNDLDDEVWDEIKRMLETLKQVFSGKHLRAGNPFFSGSWRKNTAVAFHYDFDIIVPFKQNAFKGKNVMEKLKVMRNRVQAVIYSHFLHDRNVKVRQQRFSTGVRMFFGDVILHFDIVPALECDAGNYSDDRDSEDRDLYLFGYLNAKKSSKQIATIVRTNVARQFEVIEQLDSWREIVRLLKYWKKLHNLPRPSSYAFELMVLMAKKKAPQNLGTGRGDRLEYLLLWMHRFLRNPQNGLVDVGSHSEWKDFMRPIERQHLSNRFRNMHRKIMGDNGEDFIERFFPIADGWDE